MNSGSTIIATSVSSGSNKVLFCQDNIEYYASHFYLYAAAELRCLDKNTLHDLLSSRSLGIESEDALLRLLIELGSDYFEFWSYIEVVFLSDEGLSLFVDNFDYSRLTKEVWCKILSRLTGICDEDIRHRRFVDQRKSKKVGIESNIFSDFPMILNDFVDKRWRLLYRGSRDGFESSNFHSKCDGESNTITIILTTKGFIFGGFTPIAWDLNGGHKSDSSQKSFVFSVKNPHNNEEKKFPLKNSQYAIYCYYAHGPCFGGTTDLYVASGCDRNTSSQTYLGNYYANDTGIAGNQLCTGEQYFTVKEIEVFAVSD
jgi:hypothetical protein